MSLQNLLEQFLSHEGSRARSMTLGKVFNWEEKVLNNRSLVRGESFGTFGLIIVTIFWGFGFPALKIVGDYFPTFYMIGFRFGIASIILFALFFKRVRLIHKKLIKSGLILSVILFLTYIFATVGIRYTTSARASFFSCLSVLIIPFLLRIFLKIKITKKTIISVIVCIVGLFLISYTKGMGLAIGSGDIICILCSFCYAAHVVITGVLAGDNDAALLTMIQMGFVSVFAFIIAILTEEFPRNPSALSVGTLMFLGVFGSALAFYLQTECQKFISSARVGVIFSLEPVCGVLASYLVLGDSLGKSGILGGICVFLALIYQEVDFSFKNKKKEIEDQGCLLIKEKNIDS